MIQILLITAASVIVYMTDERTDQNLTRDGHAAFLLKTEEEVDPLASIKANTDDIVGPGAGAAGTFGRSILSNPNTRHLS